MDKSIFVGWIFWVIGIIILIVVSIISFIIYDRFSKNDNGNIGGRLAISSIMGIATGVIAVILAVSGVISAFHEVPRGYIGIAQGYNVILEPNPKNGIVITDPMTEVKNVKVDDITQTVKFRTVMDSKYNVSINIRLAYDLNRKKLPGLLSTSSYDGYIYSVSDIVNNVINDDHNLIKDKAVSPETKAEISDQLMHMGVNVKTIDVNSIQITNIEN